MQRLCDAGYEVSVETSGALDISAVDTRVSRVLDLKTPGSLEVHRNRYENIELLTATTRSNSSCARAKITTGPSPS